MPGLFYSKRKKFPDLIRPHAEELHRRSIRRNSNRFDRAVTSHVCDRQPGAGYNRGATFDRIAMPCDGRELEGHIWTAALRIQQGNWQSTRRDVNLRQYSTTVPKQGPR